ncbi:extracellular solute-binding protein [Streptomyces sp. BE20]|uniref:ABC transporter substrate-binding protein n=1 Tax=unclassified Streptomyces TaxID=2593676 RepID=UPI002E761AD1|nr:MULTISPECIES: extracellular solute-binding protein [unclassified Streptomyces]MED7948813.1 extracellular solute-binding protein [Streptomyces sp. BE303]MEE1821302.1 extracellular solute-binding protein [Streptomyces sp. BE20]
MASPRALALTLCLGLVALGGAGCGSEGPPAPVAPKVAASAAEVGGMDALIRAAQQEGVLTATTLLRHWANYGGLIDGFEEKYGIKVTVDNPNGDSQDEIDDMKRYRGQERAPDVLDLGDSFAVAAAEEGLLAPYRVAAYGQIAANQKDPQARWYNSYGGYVSIGCDAARVRTCPVSFAELLKPEYKGMVALNGGSPNTAGSAFAGVYAAALANGGSFDDIKPGIDFFGRLAAVGNLNTGNPVPESIVKGETSISINWDYLNLQHVDALRGQGVDWRVSIPFDGSFSQYYAQAINKDAPHPAAARLWEEYLASPEGQNLRLVGFARPAQMAAMAKDGTLDTNLAAMLPTVEGTPSFPDPAQLEKARNVVKENWDKTVPPQPAPSS